MEYRSVLLKFLHRVKREQNQQIIDETNDIHNLILNYSALSIAAA
ncbi:hypothetical protein [Thermococcus sp.]